MGTGAPADAWRRLLDAPRTSRVLSGHGTCVVPAAPDGEPAEQAAGIRGRSVRPMRDAGGGLGVIDPGDAGGRVVTGHHDDVPTCVGPEEPQDRPETAVGLPGRAERHRDGRNHGPSTSRTDALRRKRREHSGRQGDRGPAGRGPAEGVLRCGRRRSRSGIRVRRSVTLSR